MNDWESGKSWEKQTIIGLYCVEKSTVNKYSKKSSNKNEKKNIIQEKRKIEEKVARECKGKREELEGEWLGGKIIRGGRRARGKKEEKRGRKEKKEKGGKKRKERGMERWNGREEEDREKDGGREGKWEEKGGVRRKGRGRG